MRQLSVIIPTHNPHPGRLRRALLGLRSQTLPAHSWETVLVNNASRYFPPTDFFADCTPANFTIVDEPNLGLTAARKRGFSIVQGSVIVLVDDDNELAPTYLEETLRLFAKHPEVGAIGGRSVPDFEQCPQHWVREFDDLLACRDLGETPLISRDLCQTTPGRIDYPPFAPIGAGMALRRAALTPWLDRPTVVNLTDRLGTSLSSGGDNDLVFCMLRAGWKVGYFPSLSLVHQIPASRTTRGYLASLNRGIQKSWMQVLTLHEANPFPPLTRIGVALRQVKSWFAYRAWTSPAAYIRWQGACGQFEGRNLLHLS